MIASTEVVIILVVFISIAYISIYRQVEEKFKFLQKKIIKLETEDMWLNNRIKYLETPKYELEDFYVNDLEVPFPMMTFGYKFSKLEIKLDKKVLDLTYKHGILEHDLIIVEGTYLKKVKSNGYDVEKTMYKQC